MTPREAHARYEEIVARAMRARDPAEALQRASRNPSLPADLRRALAHAAGDGARIAGILIARLRFERLLHGSSEAEAWFQRDPRAFTIAFRAYHAEVPPAAYFPRGEARAFARWAATRPSVTVAPCVPRASSSPPSRSPPAPRRGTRPSATSRSSRSSTR